MKNYYLGTVVWVIFYSLLVIVLTKIAYWDFDPLDYWQSKWQETPALFLKMALVFTLGGILLVKGYRVLSKKEKASIRDQTQLFLKMIESGRLDLAESYLRSVNEKFDPEYRKFIESKIA